MESVLSSQPNDDVIMLQTTTSRNIGGAVGGAVMRHDRETVQLYSIRDVTNSSDLFEKGDNRAPSSSCVLVYERHHASVLGTEFAQYVERALVREHPHCWCPSPRARGFGSNKTDGRTDRTRHDSGDS